MNFGHEKGEQKNFWYLNGRQKNFTDPIPKKKIKKSKYFKNYNNLYYKNVT